MSKNRFEDFKLSELSTICSALARENSAAFDRRRKMAPSIRALTAADARTLFEEAVQVRNRKIEANQHG